MVEAVRVLTQDFSYDVDSAPDMDEQQALAFSAAVADGVNPSLQALLSAMELVDVQSVASTEKSLTIGRRKRPLLGVALFGVGLALSGYLGYRGVKKAVDQSAEPARNAITRASGQELKEINKTLGLPEDTGSDEALSKFNKLGIREKMSIKNKIHALNGDADFGSDSIAGEVAPANAQAARTLGERA